MERGIGRRSDDAKPLPISTLPGPKVHSRRSEPISSLRFAGVSAPWL